MALKDPTLSEITQRLLMRWGNTVRNLAAEEALRFINVECLAFTLGVGLDQWVAAMLPMAACLPHIQFLDAVMDDVVLPAVTDSNDRAAMQAAYEQGARKKLGLVRAAEAARKETEAEAARKEAEAEQKRKEDEAERLAAAARAEEAEARRLAEFRVPLGESPSKPSGSDVERLMRNAAAGESANFAKEFASASKGCDGSGKSAPNAVRMYFATKGIRDEQQSRGAKQDDMDWKRIREALRVATDPADIAALEHDLAVLTKKGSSRPLFGVHAKQVKGKVASQKKAASKATKEEEKEKAVSEKADLKSAGWIYSGTTAQLHARWLRLIGKSPLGGDLPKNQKRKKRDEPREDDEDDEEEEAESEPEPKEPEEPYQGGDEQMEDFEVSKVVGNRWDIQFDKLEATNYFEVKWTKGDLLSVSDWLFVAP